MIKRGLEPFDVRHTKLEKGHANDYDQKKNSVSSIPVTAVKEFQRIETSGLWRARPEDQRREVVLSFGDTSLVIRDRSNAPITHWSLSAIERVNPGKRPALFEPGPDTGESLEIDDDVMISAIEKVRTAIARQRPKRGRLRFTFFLTIIAVIAAIGYFWLPGALMRHALTVVPDTKRETIGLGLLGEINRLAGNSCSQARGRVSLAKLHARLDPDNQLERILILPTDARDMILLPGKFLALSHTLVEDFDAPDVVGGYILSGTLQAQNTDPLAQLLGVAGTLGTLKLLTTGNVDRSALREHAEGLLRSTNPFPPSNMLIDAFASAGLATSPFAYARDYTGETTLELIEADPFRGQSVPSKLLDGDWVSLQSICEE
jgi:hypothetical protein